MNQFESFLLDCEVTSKNFKILIIFILFVIFYSILYGSMCYRCFSLHRLIIILRWTYLRSYSLSSDETKWNMMNMNPNTNNIRPHI